MTVVVNGDELVFFDKGAVDLCTAWREKLSENEDEIQLSVEIRVLLHYEHAKMF